MRTKVFVNKDVTLIIIRNIFTKRIKWKNSDLGKKYDRVFYFNEIRPIIEAYYKFQLEVYHSPRKIYGYIKKRKYDTFEVTLFKHGVEIGCTFFPDAIITQIHSLIL